MANYTKLQAWRGCKAKTMQSTYPITTKLELPQKKNARDVLDTKDSLFKQLNTLH